MPQTLAEELRIRVLEVASNLSAEPTIDRVEERPLFLMAPNSYLGIWHGPAIAKKLPNIVAAIDDVSTEPTMHGVPRWTSAQFLERVAAYPRSVAIDFSGHQATRALIASLCRRAGAERVDCINLQARFQMHAVYETVPAYRAKTIERLDDMLKLAERFADDYSRATLYANLLLRLSYDRSAMLSTWTNPTEEYFSSYAPATTFQVGTREHFCDCGAFRGPIVSKFLAATAHRYESITAFEPDRMNFEALSSAVPLQLPNFRPINKAVSDRSEVLTFLETGTVSSHVSTEGTVQVQTTRLDDELEHLTLLKMDVEGFEPRTLRGASRLISTQRPRIAACVYHYAQDLLDVVEAIDENADGYNYRLRQHNGSYYYDLVLYASPVDGVEPAAHAR